MTAEQDDKSPMPPPSGGRDTYQPGHVVEGLVTSVSETEVELTLDDGRFGVITRRDFSVDNSDPQTLLSVGDKTFGAELVREDPKQRVVLSRAWALKMRAWDEVTSARQTGDSVHAKVLSSGAKGVVVDTKGLRGFVPSSHLELEPIEDLEHYVGQMLELKVIEADPRRERLVLSRRAMLTKEKRQQSAELLASLKAGDVRRGRVTSLTNYGAFVDIGGVNGLIHLSELAWTRVNKASQVLSVGDEVEVKVIDVKSRRRRVGLSLKQMTVDPMAHLEVGKVLVGTVTRVVDFGAFVDVGDAEGLVHVSEMAEYRVSAPEDVVVPGQQVHVKVVALDLKRRRIELSMRQAAEFQG